MLNHSNPRFRTDSYNAFNSGNRVIVECLDCGHIYNFDSAFSETVCKSCGLITPFKMSVSDSERERRSNAAFYEKMKAVMLKGDFAKKITGNKEVLTVVHHPKPKQSKCFINGRIG